MPRVPDRCRIEGHVWPERPGMFNPDREDYFEALTEPRTDTCERCGMTRTDYPGGRRVYTYPTK